MLFDILNQAVPLLVAKWLGGIPDSKVHGANMGPIWGRQDPGGPHVGPMIFSIWAAKNHFLNQCWERPMKPLAHKRPVMQKASPCFDIVMEFPRCSAGKQLYYFCCQSWRLQGSFCVCTQPMRDDVTMLCHLSLAEGMHRIIPESVLWCDHFGCTTRKTP